MYPLRDVCSGWSGQRTLSRFFADSDNLLMPIFVWKSAFWLGKTCRFVTRFVRGLQQLYSYQTKVTFPRIAGCIPCDHSLEPKGVGQHSVPWLSVALKMELRCRSTEENRMCWDAKKPSWGDGVRDSQLMPNKRSISAYPLDAGFSVECWPSSYLAHGNKSFRLAGHTDRFDRSAAVLWRTVRGLEDKDRSSPTQVKDIWNTCNWIQIDTAILHPEGTGLGRLGGLWQLRFRQCQAWPAPILVGPNLWSHAMALQRGSDLECFLRAMLTCESFTITTCFLSIAGSHGQKVSRELLFTSLHCRSFLQ